MNEEQYRILRERMVAEQLAARDITDQRVLDVMRRVPRHRFVPPEQAAHAYDNRPLPLAYGQTISQPLMVALMLQSAQLTGCERVLEVGAGSGYQAALLAELALHVTTVERLPGLADGARAILRELGYLTIEIVLGDGSEGYPASAPYDRIIVAAAAPRIPGQLLEQLAVNGLLVAPVGGMREQSLHIVSKDPAGRVTQRDEGWCAFVPLVGAAAWPEQGTGLAAPPVSKDPPTVSGASTVTPPEQ